MSYDALTVIVWILRIVLPCVLFWISFGTKLRLPWNKAEDTANLINRDTMLLHRKAVAKAGFPAPEPLANIQLVTQESAPSLFQERRPRGEGGGRERAGRRRDDGEKGERPSRGDRGDKEERRERKKQAPPPPPEEEEEVPVSDASEEKMHLESLVNFVAFSKREQQRVFLPDAACAPPPPPKPPAKPTSALNEKGAGASAAAPQANAEAQMVLRGAMKAGSRGAAVARSLHTQLTDNGIDISATSFELMVEASVQAAELQCASDFLMRMEAAGHTPSNELLDRVMELYLQRKRDGATKSETEALESSKFASKATVAADAAGIGAYTDDAMSLMASMTDPMSDPASLVSRSKLSVKAEPFVPGGGETTASSGDGTGVLTASAPIFTPMGMPSAWPDTALPAALQSEAPQAAVGAATGWLQPPPPPPPEAERTKLSATALPFVPGGCDETYDGLQTEETYEDGTNGKSQRGRGRGGKDGKAKAKAKQSNRGSKQKQSES